MYSRILVPLDGSKLAEQILPSVRQLGKCMELESHLLNVVEPVTRSAGEAFEPPMRYLDFAEARKTDALEYLIGVAASLQKYKFVTKTLVREGQAAAEIISEADPESGTLIAMSTHGRSGLARWAFGSVTDRVLRGTRSSMLLVRSKEEHSLRPQAQLEEVIVPLDGSALADEILPHVVVLAKSMSLSVILLRAAVPPTAYASSAWEFATSEYENVLKNMQRDAADYLSSVAGQLKDQGVVRVGTRVLTGPPATALVDDCERRTSCFLTAMSTHGRSGVGRWVFGSVAERMLRHSGHPVLVIRPGPVQD